MPLSRPPAPTGAPARRCGGFRCRYRERTASDGAGLGRGEQSSPGSDASVAAPPVRQARPAVSRTSRTTTSRTRPTPRAIRLQSATTKPEPGRSTARRSAGWPESWRRPEPATAVAATPAATTLAMTTTAAVAAAAGSVTQAPRRRGGEGGGGGERDRDTELREDDVVQPVAGILDVLDNYAFVRTSGYLAGPNDVYVSMNMVRKNGLRRGDAITGAVRVAKRRRAAQPAAEVQPAGPAGHRQRRAGRGRQEPSRTSTS